MREEDSKKRNKKEQMGDNLRRLQVYERKKESMEKTEDGDT